MQKLSINGRNRMTKTYRKKLKKLSLAFLMSLSLLLPERTTSYAEVVIDSTDTVLMTEADLRTLVTEITAKTAENEALKETVQTEREAFGAYEASVEKLIAAQKEEREKAQAVIEQLKKQLKAPSLELYTGYNSDDAWEGGIRLVWRLN